ncbi:phospholipase D-like domain-containing protein [Litchfieldella anticariensis]|uniref:phospholipase D-like domain-containing protein n=1 Tax=Litchfieldella anticariensis TaxID=258591 RepID=UPI0003F89256|nr:phospholipase D-like domain-containing protein [Halomonas anticariensis]
MAKIIAENYCSERVHIKELQKLLSDAQANVDVATAYITDTKLLGASNNIKVRLLTSVSCADLISGATSLEALRWLYNKGINIRVLPSYPKFHAKVYIADRRKAVISSANLTNNGINNNIEVGVALEDGQSQQLHDWFESIWSEASPLTHDLLNSLSKYTDEIEHELSALKQKIRKFDKHINSTISKPNESRLLEFDDGSRQFFICNSDRRNGTRTADGGHLHEELMLSLGTAMAWEKFRYSEHMSRARVGDIIFLFAKRKGVIAVGVVVEPVKVADGESKKQLSPVSDTTEWRISVNWITQRNKSLAYHLDNPPLCTFMDISAEKHRALRFGVLSYFSEVGSA